ARFDCEGHAVDDRASTVCLDDAVDFDDVHAPRFGPGGPGAHRTDGRFSWRLRLTPGIHRSVDAQYSKRQAKLQIPNGVRALTTVSSNGTPIPSARFTSTR